MTTSQNYATLGPKLLAQGFEPIPVAGKRPVIKQWEDLTLSPDRVAYWAANGQGDLNVGIRTAALAPIDIDIYDAAVSARVVEAALERFGDAPRRIGQKPKALLLYAALEPGTKITSPIWVSPDGVEHRVEVLGIGQQFVAAGIHPDTHQPYTWEGDNIADLELWMLPSVSRAEVAAWISEELPALIPADWTVKGSGTAGATWDDDPFEAVKGQHSDVDIAALRVLLDALDQDKCDDRGSWLTTVLAVHHQFHGTEEELEALELVDEWSSKSVKYVTGVVPAIWDNAHEQRGGGLVTIGTLKTWAGEKWKSYLASKRVAASAAVVQDQGLEARIATADMQTLEGQLVPEIRVMELTPGVRAQLVAAVRDRFKALNAAVRTEDVRRMLTPPRAAVERADEAPDIDDGLSMAPAWAREWAWVRSEEKFIHRRTKLAISKTAFDTEMQKHVGDLLMDQNDSLVELKASERMFKHWGAKTADKLWYQPATGELATFGGLTYYNTYRPELRIIPAAAWTDAGRRMATVIERHLSLLFPNRRERDLMRAWLAHQYLHPGVKVRWAPLLKGCPGDGKSMLGELLELVLGPDNVRLMSADTVQNSDFSGWVEGQCVTVFEEVKFQGHNRFDVVNRLKPFISNNRVEKHGKGKDPGNVSNVTNYLMLTNHEDAIPIEEGDRRYFVVFSPFNTLADLERVLQAEHGMSAAEHFEGVFSLVRANPAQLALWLSETEFPAEWDPNMSAPMTEAKQAMVGNSVSEGEAVIDAILEDVAEGGRRDGIGAEVVCLDCLKAEARTEIGDRRPLADRVIGARLTKAGYRPLPGGERGKARKVRWQEKLRSVWSRGGADISNARVCELLNATLGAFAD